MPIDLINVLGRPSSLATGAPPPLSGGSLTPFTGGAPAPRQVPATPSVGGPSQPASGLMALLQSIAGPQGRGATSQGAAPPTQNVEGPQPEDPGNPPQGGGGGTTSPPITPPGPPAELEVFGEAIASALLDPGQIARMQRILSELYARNPDAFLGLLGGRQGVFGMGDLNRLLESGLITGGGRQQFLQNVLNRAGRFGSEIDPGGGDGGGGGGGPFGGGGSNFLPDNLLSQLQAALAEILANPGFGEDMLRQLLTGANTDAALRQKGLFATRADDFNARGLFGSGAQVRALEDIERGIGQDLFGTKNEIRLADAKAALQQIQTAINGILGLGQLDVSETLGLGGLGNERLSIEINRAIQELLINLQLQETFSGLGDDVDLSQLFV